MDQFALDLSLDVLDGSIHDLGHVMLWCRLRANTYNPNRPKPQMDVACRTSSHWSLTASEPRVSSEQVAGLVGRLNALGWPGRQLQVEAAPGNMAGWQHVRLRVQLDRQEGELKLLLEYGGMTGPDAEALREIFRTLVEMGLPSQEDWITGTWSGR